MDYSKLVINLGLLLFVLAAAKLAYSKFYTVLSNAMFWAILSLLFIINMTRYGTPVDGP